MIYALGLLRAKYFLTEADLERICEKLLDWSSKLQSGSYKIYVVKCDGQNTVVIAAKEPTLFLDKALQVMGSYDLEEIGATVKQKLNENRI